MADHHSNGVFCKQSSPNPLLKGLPTDIQYTIFSHLMFDKRGEHEATTVDPRVLYLARVNKSWAHTLYKNLRHVRLVEFYPDHPTPRSTAETMIRKFLFGTVRKARHAIRSIDFVEGNKANCQILTDEMISSLFSGEDGLRSLESVAFSPSQSVSEVAIMECLRASPNLKRLELVGELPSNQGFAANEFCEALKSCATIEEVTIANVSEITNEFMTALGHLPKLTCITFSKVRSIPEEAFRSLCNGVGMITCMKLDMVRVAIDAITSGKAIRNSLCRLSIRVNPTLTDDTLARILIACPNICNLECLQCESLRDPIQAAFAIDPQPRLKLRRLSLDSGYCVPLEDRHLNLNNIGRIDTLEHLRLGGMVRLSADDLSHLSALPKLQHLDLEQTTILDEAAAGAIAKCMSITSLNIFNASGSFVCDILDGLGPQLISLSVGLIETYVLERIVNECRNLENLSVGNKISPELLSWIDNVSSGKLEICGFMAKWESPRSRMGVPVLII